MICASCEKEAALFKTYTCGHCGTEFASPAGDVGALVAAFRDVMDCFWDMSPLEFAAKKGKNSIDDYIGSIVLDHARAELDKWR